MSCAFLVPIVGLILSIIGMVQINKNGGKSKGMAIAGIIVSVVVMVLNGLLVFSMVNAANSAVHGHACGGLPFDLLLERGHAQQVFERHALRQRVHVVVEVVQIVMARRRSHRPNSRTRTRRNTGTRASSSTPSRATGRRRRHTDADHHERDDHDDGHDD